MSPRRYTCSTPSELHTSRPLHLQRDSRPPDLDTSTTPRQNPASRLLDLHTSIPLCFHIYTPAASLWPSTPTMRLPKLHASMLPRLHAFSAPPELRASTPAHLQRASRVPCIHTSVLLRL